MPWLRFRQPSTDSSVVKLDHFFLHFTNPSLWTPIFSLQSILRKAILFHLGYFPRTAFPSYLPFTPTRAMIVRHGILQEFLQSLTQHFYEEAYSWAIQIRYSSFLQRIQRHSALPGHRHSGMVFRQSRPCSRRAGLLHPYRNDRHPVFKKEGSV